MKVTSVELDSSGSRAHGQVYHLRGGPQPPNPVPPPGPVVVCGKIRA